MRNPWMCAIFLGIGFLLLADIGSLATAGETTTPEWHTPYVGGGGVWRKRITVEVASQSTQELMGKPLFLKVGTQKDELPLIGANAKDIRVCGTGGVEYLFALLGPDKQLQRDGPIREGSTLVLPLELKPNEKARYFIYFDNPSAWVVPDFLSETAEEWRIDFEGPSSWKLDDAVLSTEDPHAGKQCVKLVAARSQPQGPESTFLSIAPGRVYTFSFWYKSTTTAGIWWALIAHYDATGKPTILDNLGHRMALNVKADTGGWKRFETTFGLKDSGAKIVLPENTTKVKVRFNYWTGDGLNTGETCLDDVAVEETRGTGANAVAQPTEYTVTIGPVENSPLKEAGAPEPWIQNAGSFRVPIEIRNYGAALDNVLATVNFTRINTLMQFRVAPGSIKLTGPAGNVLPHTLMDSDLLFQTNVAASTAERCYLYFSTDATTTGGPAVPYAELLASKVNLAANPDFGAGADVPDGWLASAEYVNVDGKPTFSKQSPAAYALESPGLFGKRCIKMSVPAAAPLQWCGWRQLVKNLKPNTRYLYSGWVRAENITDGDVRLHGHFKNAKGETIGYFSTPPLGTVGTMEQAGTINKGKWEQLSTVVQTPSDCTGIELHLTMHARGTVWHDGILLAETHDAVAGPLEGAQTKLKDDLTVWQTNPIAKTFKDSLPPAGATTAFRIASARNEREGLQLALRSEKDLKKVKISVTTPVDKNGVKLEAYRTDRVDFVPVDFPVGYGNYPHPPWQRTIPSSSGSDGWEGLWPDPLIPHKTPLDVHAGETQPFVITFTIPGDQKPGTYDGKVIIEADGLAPKAIPLTVTVWDFTLPVVSHVGAIFDLRSGPGWKGFSPEQLRDACKIYAEHRACTDMIRPEPKFSYANGKVTMDTTEYDAMARYCFDELHMQVCYLPHIFYAFGWGFPPRDFLGRKAFTPEYKEAYQACLKAFWEHLKKNGWADRYTLYISDEPHFDSKEVRSMVVEQMQKLCTMIHEAVPEMRIYSSTWKYEHEWDGFINHWGVGFYGCFPVEDMQRRQKAGDLFWFTTDGTFCLDTPYSSVERLYPYYCFKYDVTAYEFWGGTWWTYDPFKYGWHTSLPHTFTTSDKVQQMVRYPNGDGYFLYPGWLIGEQGFLSSVRFEQVRDGIEDFEYLHLLQERVTRGKKQGKDTSSAEAALEQARSLVSIPNKGSRRSTEILKDPETVMVTREALAREIVKLGE